MIDVENLSFERPWGTVLKDVSFVARSAVALALVGPPGSGKSTLLRCLAGLETPAEGRISIAGADPIRQPRLAHGRLGYVADGYGLYDGLSVEQSLWYAARSRGVEATKAATAVSVTAGRMGLTDDLQTLAGALGAWKRRRLAIAQATIHRPSTLLLDEPMRGLDRAGWRDLARLIGAFAAEGATVVVAAAHLDRLDGACEDLLRLEDGLTSPAGVERGGARRAISPDMAPL